MGKTARYFYRPYGNDALIPAEAVLYATHTQQKPRQRRIQAQKNRLNLWRCAAIWWDRSPEILQTGENTLFLD